MNHKNNKRLKVTLIFIGLLIITQTQGQGLEDAIGFDDGVADTPAAPIHMFVPIVMALGAYFGIVKLK